MEILEALGQLDPNDDQQWTNDGAPRIDAVAALVGTSVTRAQITQAAPHFARDNLVLSGQGGAAPDPAAEPESDEAAAAAGESAEGAPPAAEPPPEPKPIPGVPTSPQTKRYIQVSDRIVELQQVRDEIDAEMAKLQREQARLERWAPKPHVYDHKTDMANRMRFIQSQQEQRAERIGRATALIDATRSGLAGKAPIDAAMARKNTRGTGRPAVPVKPQG